MNGQVIYNVYDSSVSLVHKNPQPTQITCSFLLKLNMMIFIGLQGEPVLRFLEGCLLIGQTGEPGTAGAAKSRFSQSSQDIIQRARQP